MKAIKLLVIGIFFGAINAAPLYFAYITSVEIYLSCLITWIIISVLTGYSSMRLPATVKGLLYAILISTPTLVFTVSYTPTGAAFNIGFVIVFGMILGFMLGHAGLIVSRTPAQKASMPVPTPAQTPNPEPSTDNISRARD